MSQNWFVLFLNGQRTISAPCVAIIGDWCTTHSSPPHPASPSHNTFTFSSSPLPPHIANSGKIAFFAPAIYASKWFLQYLLRVTTLSESSVSHSTCVVAFWETLPFLMLETTFQSRRTIKVPRQWLTQYWGLPTYCFFASWHPCQDKLLFLCANTITTQYARVLLLPVES